MQSSNKIPEGQLDLQNVYNNINSVLNIIDNIGKSYGNTYFVSPGGDDSTGAGGDINKPFKTISAARNQLVDDITNNVISGETVIYVYAGEYTDSEIQYENGNFYFAAGSKVTVTKRHSSVATALFMVGKPPIHSQPQYQSNSVNIFGFGDFYLPRATNLDWNGEIVHATGTSEVYFECNNSEADRGLILFADADSKVTMKGSRLSVLDQGYVTSARDYANVSFEFSRITSVSSAAFFIRGGGTGGFYGSCDVIANVIEAQGSAFTFASLREGSNVKINSTSLTSITGFAIEQQQSSGGYLEINASISSFSGIYARLNSAGVLKFTGNMNLQGGQSIHMANNGASNEYRLICNSLIEHNEPIENSITLYRGSLILGGRVINKDHDNIGVTCNGIQIMDAGNLILDSFRINTDNFSIHSTDPRDVNVIHSFSHDAILDNITIIRDEKNHFLDLLELTKQDTLVSGSNIKTVDGQSLLGAGDIPIPPGLSLGETSTTAYRGDRGKVAYDLSQEIDTTMDFTLGLIDYFIVDYAGLKINSVQNILNTPTVTLTIAGVPYVLGTSLSLGTKLDVSVSTASVIKLKGTR